MHEKTKYIAAGDKALIIEFGDKIEEEVSNKIRELNLTIANSNILGIDEMVPTYRSLMVIYDPMFVGFDKLAEEIKDMENRMSGINLPVAKVVEIPTLYSGEYGPDINFVAEHNNMSVEEVIKIHTSGEYLIYMIGFTPGFPYLGGMSERIATPRLQVPRTKIPPGSVGIAGSQTGIYPIESPGGWQLIGRTPVKLYDPYRSDPVLLSAGDYIKFVSVTEKEYRDISNMESKGKYRVVVRDKDRR